MFFVELVSRDVVACQAKFDAVEAGVDVGHTAVERLNDAVSAADNGDCRLLPMPLSQRQISTCSQDSYGPLIEVAVRLSGFFEGFFYFFPVLDLFAGEFFHGIKKGED